MGFTKTVERPADTGSALEELEHVVCCDCMEVLCGVEYDGSAIVDCEVGCVVCRDLDNRACVRCGAP